MVKIQFSNGRIVEFEKQPTDQEIDEVAKKIGATSQPATQAKPLIEPNQPSGFLQSMAQGAVSPFARSLATGASAVRGTGGAVLAAIQALLGQKDTAKQTLAKAAEPVIVGQKGGYLGQYSPYGIDEAGRPLGGLKTAQQAIGGSVEMASWLPGVGAVPKLAKATLMGKIGQGAVAGAKGGAIASGMMGFGAEMQKPEATMGSVATSGILGAGFGAAGGGLFGGALPIIPAVYKVVNPSIKDSLFRAIKPYKNKTYFDKNLQQSIPIMAQTEKEMGLNIAKSENPIKDLTELLRQAKKNVWKSWEQLKSPAARVSVNGNNLADKIDGMVTDTMKLLNPGITEKIKLFTNQLRKQLSVDELEKYLEGINAELSGYYAKNPAARRYAQTNPETAYLVKTAQVIREAIHSKLGEVTGNTGKQLKQLYGALDDVWEETLGRYNVAMRQAPMNLQETIHAPWAIARAVGSTMTGQPIQAAESLAQLGLSKWAKDMNTTEGLIRKAFSKMRGIKYEPMPKIKPIPQLLLPGSGQTSGAIKLPSAGILQGQAKTGIKPPQQMYGAVAGFELDENGKPRFNPEKAAGGVLAVGALGKISGKKSLFKQAFDERTKRKQLIIKNPKAKEFEGLWTGRDDRVAGIVGIDRGQNGNITYEAIKKYITPEMEKQLKNFSIDKPEKVYRVQRKGYEIQPLTAWTRNLNWAKQHAKLNPDFEILETIATPQNTFVDLNKLSETGIGEIVLKKNGLKLKEYLPQSIAPIYKETGGLTTSILKNLEGKSVVSKQYIQDLAKMQNVKQKERDIINDVLAAEKGDKIAISDFATKVKQELLPLKLVNANTPIDEYTSRRGTYTGQRYEGITLPNKLRGNVANYSEHIWESPIKTSAGEAHFTDASENYFGHTRIEDLADKNTRRVIEVQSDLYQRGRLEQERLDFAKQFTLADIKYDSVTKKYRIGDGKQSRYGSKKELTDLVKRAQNRDAEIAKLQQYNDPTAHFRMVREEVALAARDGKTKLQFPTGETAMKIEGLGDYTDWYVPQTRNTAGGRILRDYPMKVGMEIARNDPAFGGRNYAEQNRWIVTEVLGDGKFKAIEKTVEPDAEYVINGTYLQKYPNDYEGQRLIKQEIEKNAETFDISDKKNTSNPIYKFYESDLGKYLKSKYNAKSITDEKGVSWWEVDITPKHKSPVEAFGFGAASLPVLQSIDQRLKRDKE